MEKQMLKANLALFIMMVMACVFVKFAVADNYTMKLAVVTQNDPLHSYIKEFKTRIEDASSGRIKAKVFPAAQLGSVARLIEGAELGTVELVAFPAGFLKGVNPAFQVVDAPGLFSGMKHAQDTCTDPEFRDVFLNLAANKGITGISVWAYSPTSYATLSPIRTLEDFKGKKIRVMASKVETGLMDSVGAVGVPMPFVEITPGMQRKTIDGVRSSIVVLAGIKLFSVSKYITTVNDSIIVPVALVSNAFLKKLPDDLKQIVFKVGMEMEDRMFKESLEFNKKAADIWKSNGAEVISFNENERKEFMKKGLAITDEVFSEETSIKPYYELLKKVANKH